MRDLLTEVLSDDTGTDERVTKLLAGTLVLALFGTVFFAVSPLGTGAAYTEFYILGPNGTASNYPENVSVGETTRVELGVRNAESHRLTYTLTVRANERNVTTRDIVLNPQGKWEESIPVTFESPGTRSLQMNLYIGETPNGEPYRELRLLVNVTSPSNETSASLHGDNSPPWQSPRHGG